jgi:hypothetical protein
MKNNDTVCKFIGNPCRHLSINYKIEKKQCFDKDGFPIYRNGNLVFEVVCDGTDREYCNDAGEYIKNMTKCPLNLKKEEPNHEFEKVFKDGKQITLEKWW